MLQIKDLEVKTNDDKTILKDLSLYIKKGEIHVLMGPNGSGKSTLSKVIMAHPDYKITNGDILFNKKSIKDLETDEIARSGIFLTMQAPIHVEGVSNSEFLKTAVNSKEKIDTFEFIEMLDKALVDLNMDHEMIHRSINKDFSGGERKKNEILQMKLLKPKLIMLDELDSGLDVDSLQTVMKSINNYLEENKDTSVLIITHYPKILEYIKPDYVHVLTNKKISRSGDHTLAEIIDKDGYKDFEK